MRGFFFIPLQALLLTVAVRAGAATWIYSSVLTPGQFAARPAEQPMASPPAVAPNTGQQGPPPSTSELGPPQTLNNLTRGQAVLQFDDDSLAWSVSGTYNHFQGNILGVELFGAAAMGYSAPTATRYAFVLENDGGMSGSFTGAGVFLPTQADDLRSGLLAISIQSSAGAQDSIRGQVISVPEAGVSVFIIFAGLAVVNRRSNRLKAG